MIFWGVCEYETEVYGENWHSRNHCDDIFSPTSETIMGGFIRYVNNIWAEEQIIDFRFLFMGYHVLMGFYCWELANWCVLDNRDNLLFFYGDDDCVRLCELWKLFVSLFDFWFDFVVTICTSTRNGGAWVVCAFWVTGVDDMCLFRVKLFWVYDFVLFDNLYELIWIFVSIYDRV